MANQRSIGSTALTIGLIVALSVITVAVAISDDGKRLFETSGQG